MPQLTVAKVPPTEIVGVGGRVGIVAVVTPEEADAADEPIALRATTDTE